ncbi:hypothetical protein CBM2592_B100371 [Cupriavidus taiwanensis]|nr:hypothetical protein CBM2592_B100371 [Cupriavidus taiwanensis]SOY63094.1 hypothetical protein CBM2588_B130034 [Cupriavidus taiwanensis]SOY98157.1 hypothetical protein CBM2591_B80372 [Cupriavidus taiwanensis]SOZ85218.1 hypothetical protein CBM2618_B130049 [Cupriavidus taiwanensis]SOZ88680.1 hypothetical protein CBM2622_B140051 [Cupriavidus taiwanensis]
MTRQADFLPRCPGWKAAVRGRASSLSILMVAAFTRQTNSRTQSSPSTSRGRAESSHRCRGELTQEARFVLHFGVFDRTPEKCRLHVPNFTRAPTLTVWEH